MNTKVGIASNVKLLMIPKIREGSALKKSGSMTPRPMPSAPKITATPPSPKATGYPLSSATISARNIRGASTSPG